MGHTQWGIKCLTFHSCNYSSVGNMKSLGTDLWQSSCWSIMLLWHRISLTWAFPGGHSQGPRTTESPASLDNLDLIENFLNQSFSCLFVLKSYSSWGSFTQVLCQMGMFPCGLYGYLFSWNLRKSHKESDRKWPELKTVCKGGGCLDKYRTIHLLFWRVFRCWNSACLCTWCLMNAKVLCWMELKHPCLPSLTRWSHIS